MIIWYKFFRSFSKKYFCNLSYFYSFVIYKLKFIEKAQFNGEGLLTSKNIIILNIID